VNATATKFNDAVQLKFHHLGLAVRRPERAVQFLAQVGYEIGEAVFDPEQDTNLMMCMSQSMPDVEIIYPGKSDGPLKELLANQSELIYHICYEVDCASTYLQLIRERGMKVGTVSPPKPALLFGDRKVSFHQVLGFGLIELLEPK